MQFQADLLQKKVIVPRMAHLTARGAAFLAGLGVGFWKDEKELEKFLGEKKNYQPHMKKEKVHSLYTGWKRAVTALLSHACLEKDDS